MNATERQLAREPVAASTPNTLGGVLRRLGITVIPLHRVDTFRRAFQRKERLRVIRPDALLGTLFAALAVLAGFGAWAIFPSNPTTLWDVGRAALTTVLAIATGLSLAFVVAFGGMIRLNWRLTRWTETRLEFYGHSYFGQHLTTPAMALVHSIREQAPTAGFFVARLHIDPFLYVEMGGERYCIYHWDEPFTE